ncbi:MAG: hypothetical protein M3R24_40625, partial [Chloroflexota bacterium]|nr:hypothetical protein [Chloroflexota bacterium]
MSSPDVTVPENDERQPSHARLLRFSFDVQAVRAVLSAYVITRLMIFLLIFVSQITIPLRPGPGQLFYADPNNIMLDGLIRWDSWSYASIIGRGYSLGNPETGALPTVPFFPVYPLLVQLVAGVIGNIFVAGVLVSNIAFLIALGYL